MRGKTIHSNYIIRMNFEWLCSVSDFIMLWLKYTICGYNDTNYRSLYIIRVSKFCSGYTTIVRLTFHVHSTLNVLIKFDSKHQNIESYSVNNSFGKQRTERTTVTVRNSYFGFGIRHFDYGNDVWWMAVINKYGFPFDIKG